MSDPLPNPDVTITNMSTNMILRIDANGSIWAKIARPTRELGQSSPGVVYIAGVRYTTSSYEFEKIFN
jgi:hypothetical protein